MTTGRRSQTPLLRTSSAFFVALAVLIAACERQPLTHPVRDSEWWRSGCGDVSPLGVGHDVTPPVLLERVDLQWPDSSVRGVIILETIITADGTICAARVVRGLGPEMNRAAIEAVKRWRFTPASFRGEPRAVRYNITINPHLRR